MSKEFCVRAIRYASWMDNHVSVASIIVDEDIPDFIAWLQEGPPKPKWRITREFDERPIQAFTRNSLSFYDRQTLTDDDVEEVTE